MFGPLAGAACPRMGRLLAAPQIALCLLSRRSLATVGTTVSSTSPSSASASDASKGTSKAAGRPSKGGGTGIVLMNMGGPPTQEEVEPFLARLFGDPDLIPIPWQGVLAPLIARRRAPRIAAQYAEIGGGSPIQRWTEAQGAALARLLDAELPGSAPHVPLVAFRYAPPLTEAAVRALRDRGISRAIAFTQYPQYSCSTTGSSLNDLYRAVRRLDPQGSIAWSVIDRWPTHPGLVAAFVDRINAALQRHYKPEERDDVVLLFSAHSLPMTVVERGDPYVQEVAATVQAVADAMGNRNAFRLSWQSKVGPRAWMPPSTADTLKAYGAKGIRNVLLVPIAFTSDHIETLYELDIEVAHEARNDWGVTGLHRAESLNDSPIFVRAMADIVKAHLAHGQSTSKQLGLQCPMCTKATCRTTKDFFAAQRI